MAAEIESNGTRGTATTVALGSTVTGSHATPADVDYFGLTTATAGVLKIDLADGLPWTYPPWVKVTVERADGLVLAAFRPESREYLEVGLPDAGIWYLRLDSQVTYGTQPSYQFTTSLTPGNPVGNETEPNDGWRQAEVLSAGATMQGQYLASTDVDWYRIDLGSPGILTLDFSQAHLLLFDPGGALLMDHTAASGRVSIAAPEAGSYLLRLQNQGFWSGTTYDVRYTVAGGDSSAWETEPNDNRLSGTILPLSQTKFGQLAHVADRDYFSITVASAGTLRIDARPQTASSQPGATEFNTFLRFTLVDDRGILLGEVNQPFSTAPLEFSVSQAGTYHLLAQGSGAGNLFDGTYSLSATHVAAVGPVAESESNDERAIADAWQLDKPVVGDLATLGDVDYFRLDLTAAGFLDLQFAWKTLQGSPAYRLRIEDAAGNRLAEVEHLQYTQVDAQPVAAIAGPGTYFVRLERQQGQDFLDDSRYELEARFTQASIAGNELENNDLRGTANALAVGASVRGHLSTIQDLDYFAFSVATAGVARVNLHRTAIANPNIPKDGRFRVSVEDSTGQVLLGAIDLQDNTHWDVALYSAGTYFVRVTGERSNGFSTLPYDLQVDFTAGGQTQWEHETNDQRATATPLAVGGSIRGQASSGSDQDYFRVHVDGPGSLRLDVQLPAVEPWGASPKYLLTIEDADGHALGGTVVTDLQGTLTVGVAGAGDVFVRLISNDFPLAAGGYPYTLSAGFTPAPANTDTPLELEPNDTRDTAQILGLGKTVTAIQAGGPDADFFALQLAAPGLLTVTLDNGLPTQWPYELQLQDESGNVLAAISHRGATGSHVVAVQTAGTYYLKVGWDSGDFFLGGYTPYTLGASFAPGAIDGYERERNDTPALATPLPVGSSIRGQQAYSDDVDYFIVQPAGTGLLYLDLSFVDGLAQHRFLMSVTNLAGEDLAASGFTQSGAVSIPVTSATPVYVRLTNSEGRLSQYGTTDYLLGARLVPIDIQVVEPEVNDTYDRAVPLLPGQARTGQLWWSGDVDWYAVDVAALGTLAIQLNLPATDAYRAYNIEVADATGTVLATFTDMGDGTAHHVGVEAAGSYRIGISSSLGAVSYVPGESYVVQASALPGMPQALETEPNDSLTGADLLSLNGTLTGHKVSLQDADIYRLDLTTASTVSVAVDAVMGVQYGYWLLRLEDAEGQLMTHVRSEPWEGQLRLQVGLDRPGTYFLHLETESSIIGAYHPPIRYAVQTTTVAGTTGWETEPNNTLQGADALAQEVPVNGQLTTAGDIDYFRFLAPSTGTYRFILAANPYPDRYTLTLEDDAGNSLATVGQPIARAPSEMVVALVQGQTYHLRVSGGIIFANEAGYSVQVLPGTTAPLRYESEPNDTPAGADRLALGEQINGFVGITEDQDHFGIAVALPGVLSINLDSRLGEDISELSLAAYTVRVFDTAGALIARQDVRTDGTLDVVVPNAGDVDVVVTSRLGYQDLPDFNATAPYRLSATWRPDGAGLEVEHNDIVPNRIVDGVPILGQLHSGRDLDKFVLQVDQSSTLLIDLAYTATLSDIFLEVRDSAGTLLGVHTGPSDGSAAETWMLGVASPGDYTFTVRPEPYWVDFGASPAYRLSVDAVPSRELFESEGNDTSATADVLQLGGRIKGALSTVADADHYQVTLSASGMLAIDFDAPTNNLHTSHFQITLRDSLGATLLHRFTGTDAALRTGVLAAGTYDIAVAFGNISLSAETYSLQVSRREAANPPSGALLGSEAGELLQGSEEGDSVYGRGGDDRISGGAGADTLVFESSLLNLDIASAAGLTAVRGNFAAGVHAYSVSRIWQVEMLRTDDSLIALPTSAQVPLIGTRIDDVLVGTPDDDLLDGLGGNDLINGQGGNDTLALLGLRSAFTLMTVGPVTRIQGILHEYAGTTIKAWNVETLAFDQAQTVPLTGTGGSVIFGVAGDDRWTGTADDETFDGQGGNDTLDGGAGSDSVLFFDRIDNFTISYPGAGSSAVTVTGKPGSAYAGQTLVARHVETLRFADGAIEVANPPGLVLRSSNSALDEGGSAATLQVSLAAAPGQPITLTVSAGLQLSTNTGQLHFDAQNWATPQLVQVRAIDDTAREADQTGVLQLAITTSDPLYATVDDVALPYRISDNGNDNATTGGVRGRLWHDFDKDSVIDASEVGLQGWTVFDDTNRNGVPDGDEPRTVSDALGQYLLGGLAPGVHTLVAVPETGWLPSAQAAGGSRATAITYTAADGEVQLEGPIVGPQGGAGTVADYANLGRATRIAEFHADPRFAGIDGRGSAVVLIDTGIDRDHPSFGADANQDGTADRIVFQYDFTGTNGPDVSDTRGHGTHVAGIVGSSDPAYPGIAPGVNLIVLKVFPSDRSRGASTADLIEAANWVVEHAAQYNIVAVNMSLGAGNYADAYNGYLSTQLQALANLGVVAVASSGNRYPDSEQQGVGYPSADPNALSVGAVWAEPGTWPYRGQIGTTDAIAFFSQRDDTQSDIFAPGVFITSAEAGGSQVAYSGTSMAAPQISGMVALAQQLARETLGRSLSFDEIRDLLSSTGAPILDGDNENDTVANTGLTFRRADMLALAEAVLALQPQASRSVQVLAGVNAVDQDFGFAATASPSVLDVDDIIVGAYWGDVLRGGGGNDRMQGAAGNDRMRGDAGDDDLDGGPDHDHLQGDAGRDTLRGGTGIDTLEGGDSDDVYFVDNPFDEVRESQASRAVGGTDTVWSEVDRTLGDHLEILVLTGSRARNGTGNALDNSLTGNALDNLLRGGAGADTLMGGDGRDTLEGGAGADSLVGGSGFDAADYSQATGSVSAELWRQFALNDGQGGQDALLGIEALLGSAQADLLAGAGGADSLRGGGGADGLYAAGGDDTLTGDAGQDTMDGGSGSDLADYSFAPAGVRVELWRALAPDDGHGNQDALWNIERVVGSAWNDFLVGGTGADELAGGAGTDTLVGGLGHDSLIGGPGSDRADYSAALGPVTAELWRQAALQDGYGAGDLLVGIERLTGSSYNDLLAGANSADVLEGGAGDDGLYAAGGNDTLTGGDGNDTLDGGADWDTADYSAAAGPVTAELWRSVATADGAAGQDALWNIEGLVGTAFADQLAGGNGNDGLWGADGNDTLAGRGGNDTLDGGAGRDLADYGSASGPVVAELWRAWALQDGTGGQDQLLNLEGLSGSPWADLLAGAGNHEFFSGGAGNDGIYAAGGNDTLAGGAGRDTLDGGPGVDTADYSSATSGVTAELWRSYALNDGQGSQDALWNIEAVIGSPQADLLAGAANNESFIGGAGNDGIYAAGGNDTLAGGTGLDTLDGGSGTDLADYASAPAGVTAELWRSYALNDGHGSQDALWNIEDLSGSAQADLLAGTNTDNRLSGQGGADQLYAAGGNDTLAGGQGNDILNGGSGADTFVFDTTPGGGNMDVLQDFSPVDDTLQLAGSVFTALAAPGALVVGMLRSAAGATAAADANDFLIYNSSTGALYYDADGNGLAQAPVQFAVLGVGLALGIADFTVA